jgi:hypothetical protein
MAGNLYDKANDQRGLLQRIASHIPGFGGYQDREMRRDADRLEREFVGEKVLSQKNAVKRTVDELMSNGNYDGLAAYEKIMNKLDKVGQRIKNASQGYSGMFDTIKFDEKALEALYGYDLGLVEGVKELEGLGTELQASASDAAKASAKAKQFSDLVDKIDDYFSRRAEYLTRS